MAAAGKQFVADASHELKTPLTVILTNTELLQSRDYDTAQKQTFLSGIDAMAKQMRALVERLLDWRGPRMNRRRVHSRHAISVRSLRAARCCSRPRCLNAV